MVVPLQTLKCYYTDALTYCGRVHINIQKLPNNHSLMVQLPLAVFTSPATNPCSWPLGLSLGRLSDTYCSALIIDDGAIGTMDEDKCNSQSERLQKCKKCSLVAKRRGEAVVTPEKCVCLQPNAVRVTMSTASI